MSAIEALKLEAAGAIRPASGAVVEPRPFATVDLVEVARKGIAAPTLLFDGLLYQGMLHTFAGPPDCGKSTLGYKAALDLLQAGDAVVVLDEEGGHEVVVEKFLALGAEPEDLPQLHYVEFPSRSWDEADRAGLEQLLAQARPTMVLVDSAGAFLAVAGRNENWAEHTIPFYKLLLGMAREFDTAVFLVDHVARNDANGRYARGSGSKLQIADVAYMVDAVVPFSRAQDGLIKLKVSKDRRGYLHRQHEVKVSTSGGPMTLEITRVELGAAPGAAGMKPATRKVLAALEALGQPATIRHLGDWIAAEYGTGLRRETMSRALTELCRDDLAAEIDMGSHGAKYWHAVKEENPSSEDV